MVMYYVYKVANDCFCQIFIICGYYEQLRGFFGHPVKIGKAASGLILPMVTCSNPRVPGLCARLGYERGVVTPPGTAAATSPQSSAGGNTEQSAGKSNPK